MAVLCGLLLLLSGCFAPNSQNSATKLEFFRPDVQKRPVYRIDNPYSSICLLLHDEISGTPERQKEINDSVLTKLYFSPLFTKVLGSKEAVKELPEKVFGLKNLELLKYVGKSVGVRAFLYAAVNKSQELVRDKIPERDMGTWARFTNTFLDDKVKHSREKVVEFSITFSFIDASTGRTLWSKKGSISSEQAVDSSTFLLIKRTVKELVGKFGSDMEKIKREAALVKPSELNVKAYPLPDAAELLRNAYVFRQKELVRAKTKQKLADSKKAELAKKTSASALTAPKALPAQQAQQTTANTIKEELVKPAQEAPNKEALLDVPIPEKAYRMRLSLSDTEPSSLPEENNMEYELLDAVVAPRTGAKRRKKKSKAEARRRYIAREIKSIMQQFGEKDFEVVDDFVKAVELYMKKWKRGKKSNFSKLMARGRENNSFSIATSVLKKYNLPVELVYIALYESGFDPLAVSSAGAVGLWQMIASTGYRYKLCDNKKCRGRDDRTDPFKSTIAAAKYISDLLAEFGGPYVMLAMAAYNLGENGLRRRLRKLKDPIHQRNFWFIYKTKLIPRETRRYVLRIISAIILGREFEKAHP